MNVDTSALDLEIQNNQTSSQLEPNMEPENTPDQSFLRKWGGLVVLSLALAIIIIDTTLLNVSLRAIITDLHTDLKSMQWVITIYSLILAAFTITGGRLGDLYGRKKMFLVGAIIFAVGSFIASISSNIGMMIAGEAIIEGIGAALMMPATASLLITNFKGRDRALAFGVWGGIAAASSAIGPIIGGWLTTNYSWRWGFRINIVVVALVLIGAFLIRENHQLRGKSKIDFVGILLSSLGLLSIVFGFIQASTYGWFKVKEQLVFLGHTLNLGSVSATPLFIVIGILILVAFIFWERYTENRGKTPLVSLKIFKNQPFVAGISTMGVLALGQAGLFFTIPVFLQAVRHLDALHTGLTLLPMSIALLIAAPLSAFLNKFVSPKHLVQIGLVLSVIAFIVLRASLSVNATTWDLAPGFILFGFGMGLLMAQVSNLTLSSVSPEEAGEASGVNNTTRMIGQTLGSAILGAILLSALVTNVNDGISKSKVIPDQAKPAIEQKVSEHISDISFGEQENASAEIPQAIASELNHITNNSIVDANKTVMVYGLIFILLGLAVSTQLPNSKNENEPAGIPEATDEETDRQEIVISKRTARWLIALGVGIIAMMAIILANIKTDKFKNDESSAVNSTRPQTDSQTQITPNSEQNNPDNNNVVEETHPSTTNTDMQTPSNIESSASEPTTDLTPLTSTSTSPYSNHDLHFAFEKPADWQIVKNNNGEVVFKSGAMMFNIQSSEAVNGDYETLKMFLEEQPNIHNIRVAKFGNRDVYRFNIDGLYQTGYAFLENGRLFYILGPGSETTPLVDIRTF